MGYLATMFKVCSVISVVSAFASPACDSESCSTEEVTLLQYKSKVDSQANDALLESASRLVREVQGSLLTVALSRFRASHGNTSIPEHNDEETDEGSDGRFRENQERAHFEPDVDSASGLDQ